MQFASGDISAKLDCLKIIAIFSYKIENMSVLKINKSPVSDYTRQTANP